MALNMSLELIHQFSAKTKFSIPDLILFRLMTLDFCTFAFNSRVKLGLNITVRPFFAFFFEQ